MRPVREARLALALLVRERWPEMHEQIQAADKGHTGQVRSAPGSGRVVVV